VSKTTKPVDLFQEAIRMIDVSSMPGLKDACVSVHRALCIAHASALQTFRDQTKPEHTIEICRLMMLEYERKRAEDDLIETDDDE